MRLAGADIGTNLTLRGATIDGSDTSGHALCAEQLHVGGSLFLSEPDQVLRLAGALWLQGARIDSKLTLAGVRITRPHPAGNSVSASGMRVTGDLVLTDLSADGGVCLTGAHVGGDVDAGRAQVGAALVAEGIEVRGNLSLSGLRAEGDVVLRRAAAHGELDLSHMALAGHLVLQQAQCRSLRDEGDWPATGHLALCGFTYLHLEHEDDKDPDRRLEWLQRQGFEQWSPEPYEQLAAYYRTAGDENAARRIKIAKHDDELRHLRTVRPRDTLGYRCWRRPFGWLLGYGYQRHRAGWLLVATVALAGATFSLAWHDGAMAPNVEADLVDDVDRQGCGASPECFNAWVYGADVVLPIVDFDQDTSWRPVTTGSAGVLWRGARWVFVAIGWALASVFVAAFSGMVQRQ